MGRSHVVTECEQNQSIDNGYQIPTRRASANVHSVSAVGEQPVDLVSTRTSGPYGMITTTTVLDWPRRWIANRGLAVPPKDRVAVLHEGVGGAAGILTESLEASPRYAQMSGAASTSTTSSSWRLSSIARSIPQRPLGRQPQHAGCLHRAADPPGGAKARPTRHRLPIRSTPRSKTCAGVVAAVTLANLEVVIDMSSATMSSRRW